MRLIATQKVEKGMDGRLQLAIKAGYTALSKKRIPLLEELIQILDNSNFKIDEAYVIARQTGLSNWHDRSYSKKYVYWQLYLFIYLCAQALPKEFSYSYACVKLRS